ncbi:MAG: hypothetical protein ABEH43_04880 [Flavobacteriales bacterium]
MNASAGSSFDFFASDIKTSGEYFAHFTDRKMWVQMALIGNFGFEYRTKNSGYFYIGGSFHRPYTSIAVSSAKYVRDDNNGHFQKNFNLKLAGQYITLDFRYFFGDDGNSEETAKPQNSGAAE